MISVAIIGTMFFLPSIIVGLLWGLFFGGIGALIRSDKLKKYSLNVLISFDQLGNTLWLGDPDETISSRAGKGKMGLWGKMLCYILDKIDENHCIKSIELDEGSGEI